jgi:hypothetical protein
MHQNIHKICIKFQHKLLKPGCEMVKGFLSTFTTRGPLCFVGIMLASILNKWDDSFSNYLKNLPPNCQQTIVLELSFLFSASLLFGPHEALLCLHSVTWLTILTEAEFQPLKTNPVSLQLRKLSNLSFVIEALNQNPRWHHMSAITSF